MKPTSQKEPTTKLKDMVFYTGTYKIENDKITHHVQNTANLEFFGKDLERTLQFENQNRITLLGKGMAGRQVRLVWERMQKNDNKN